MVITIDVIQATLQSINRSDLLLQFKEDMEKTGQTPELLQKYYNIIQKEAVIKEKFENITNIQGHPMITLHPIYEYFSKSSNKIYIGILFIIIIYLILSFT
jgi:hypothetical protein